MFLLTCLLVTPVYPNDDCTGFTKIGNGGYNDMSFLDFSNIYSSQDTSCAVECVADTNCWGLIIRKDAPHLECYHYTSDPVSAGVAWEDVSYVESYKKCSLDADTSSRYEDVVNDNCVYYDWKQFGSCSTTCGPGVARYSRSLAIANDINCPVPEALGTQWKDDVCQETPCLEDMPGSTIYTEYVGSKCDDQSATLIDYWDCESNHDPMESLFRGAYDANVNAHQNGIHNSNITDLNLVCERACEMHGNGCAGFTAIDEKVWTQKLLHPEGRLHSCGDFFYECKLYSSCSTQTPGLSLNKPFWVHVTRTIEDYCHNQCESYPGDWTTKCSYAPCGACANCDGSFFIGRRLL